jgi:hypothetical protein
MKALLDKQITVALEGDGETSRKAREFLLKTFMTALSEQAAKTAEKRKEDLAAERKRPGYTSKSRGDMFGGEPLIDQIKKFPKLWDQVIVALGGPPDDVIFGDTTTQPPPEPAPEDPVEQAVAEPEPEPENPVEDPVQEVQEEAEDEPRTGRKMEDPFISGPRRMREASEEANRSALAEGPIRRKGHRR